MAIQPIFRHCFAEILLLQNLGLRRGYYKTIADAMQLKDRDTVCDIAAGFGHSISILAEFLPPSTVYFEEDINQTFCNRRSFKNTFSFYNSDADINQFRFFKGKADKIPFANESFSNIVVFISLHEFTAINPMLQEIKRILRKQGRVFIFESVYKHTPVTDINCKLPYLSEQALTDLLLQNQFNIIKDMAIGEHTKEENEYGRFMVCRK